MSDIEGYIAGNWENDLQTKKKKGGRERRREGKREGKDRKKERKIEVGGGGESMEKI